MAVETRPELVGKRFLCLALGEEARLERGESGRCWRGWRAGVIRAVSHRDSRNPDLAVQNFHSCIQVTEDFVSPEHLVQSFHLTQELRLLKEEINYDDKLQVKNILYHAVKEMVRALKIHEDEVEAMEEN